MIEDKTLRNFLSRRRLYYIVIIRHTDPTVQRNFYFYYLRGVAKCCFIAIYVKYIIKHLFHENPFCITF